MRNFKVYAINAKIEFAITCFRVEAHKPAGSRDALKGARRTLDWLVEPDRAMFTKPSSVSGPIER